MKQGVPHSLQQLHPAEAQMSSQFEHASPPLTGPCGCPLQKYPGPMLLAMQLNPAGHSEFAPAAEHDR
jgi:hypothetical protein